MEKKKIAVIGAGGWGTTIAKILSENGQDVSVWVHDKETFLSLQNERENKIFLPGVKLPENVKFFREIESFPSDIEAVFLVVPSAYFRDVAHKVVAHFKDKVIYVTCTKGLEEQTFYFMSQVLEDELKKIGVSSSVVALSGPNLAREVAQKIPSATVVASLDKSAAIWVQDILMNHYFRVYTSGDVLGIQIGGAIKNIIAIAAGISDGLGYGANTKATLLTRGMVEISRMGIFLGARQETFFGLSGMGDLMATCNSPLSRNYSYGLSMVKKNDLGPDKRMVVEGVETVGAVWQFSQKNSLDLPICQQVYDIIYNKKDIKECVLRLMQRTKKEEFTFTRM